MIRFLALALALAAPASAQESSISGHQSEVIGCMLALEQKHSTVPECVGLLYAPCLSFDIGTEEHTACLQSEHHQWNKAMRIQLSSMAGRLTDEGRQELTGVMGQWVSVVIEKCAASAAELNSVEANAARLGCQMNEIVTAMTEFAGCEQGLMTPSYCAFKQ